ncbi:MAG: Nucleoside diphosphate kinase [candidate division WWE3 bacterium GW2011_GWF2_41_45]|uniref:nucleoside-diphosphate kinase n=3 Tax=Katanobacteria TaxID=422282 RepID=A0A1F4W0K0_UNCKA|nr:MAG: Nucleoside diphosphate kinase [candidate division WWE3 bacterium GW2011_GWC2_41_23]KKS10218.1 MAG: Nucleoside diphosphate kinase [candidate division WWE3 bacterium GW2011_GWF2_41_45]KKS19560.1 MAG: Nucleoside diphosphate kinase [candidate division WWE3 bacterium GW2011_GWE1_41_72]KKS25837.1 MAG: Nucleoside diphosphate kinase [candidate division WWE3 bacterium GW2011_GWC1_42_102]KKS28409.1 MAG: Nucleoside diphosphate kinase [candidate division WWE3 bacterium GW2011_GWD2_42_11]KKS50506.1
MKEKTLVLLKPDAVARGITGEIIDRLEQTGLKIVGAKLLRVDKQFGSKHYNHNDEWKEMVGKRNIADCEKFGLAAKDVFGTEDVKRIGEMVDERNADFLASGPVFAIVFEGPNAVAKVRNMVGSTFPDTAPPGTIRGDYGLDSAFSGMIRKRTTYNVIHASGSVDEAVQEINLWFKPEELIDYRRVHEDLYNY